MRCLNYMPRLNQQGVISQLLVLLLLAAGLAGGLYLVKHPQVFKPKASVENIEWVTSNSSDQDNCISVQQGKTVATCPKVKFRVNVPQQVP